MHKLEFAPFYHYSSDDESVVVPVLMFKGEIAEALGLEPRARSVASLIPLHSTCALANFASVRRKHLPHTQQHAPAPPSPWQPLAGDCELLAQ